jgi:hypothetical protein
VWLYGNSFNYFNAAFHILTDILLAVLPIPVLAKLQLSRKRKITLATVFGVEILTIAATIVRQVYNFIALTQLDFSWNWAPVELVTNLEINMGLICASVPAIQTLFKTAFGITSEPYASYPRPGHSKTTSSGLEWYSKGRDKFDSVREISHNEHSSNEDRIVIQGNKSELESGSRSEPCAVAGNTLGRVKTTVSISVQSEEDMIQLREMGAKSREGVLKSTHYRVDYSAR